MCLGQVEITMSTTRLNPEAEIPQNPVLPKAALPLMQGSMP